MIKTLKGGGRIFVIDDKGNKYEFVDYDWEYTEESGYVIPVYSLKLQRKEECRWIGLEDLQWWLLKGAT